MDKRRSRDLPAGVDAKGKNLRIWFIYPKGSKKKRYEPLERSNTPANIVWAGRYRQQIKDEIKHGVFQYARHFPNSRHADISLERSFQHYAQSWLDSPKNDWKPQSRYKYKGILNRIWMPSLHDKLMHLITHADLTEALTSAIDGFKAQYEREPSKSIYNDWLTAVRGPFSIAVADKVVHRLEDPTIDLTNKTRVKAIPDPYDEDEANMIIDSIYGRDGPVHGAWHELGFYSGLRSPSEPGALMWTHVNRRKTPGAPFGFMRIEQIRSKHADTGIQDSTKTGEIRTVLLNSRSRHAIDLMLEITGFKKKWVFLQENGEPFITGDPFRKSWSAAVARLGLRYRPPYSMRSFYATYGLMGQNNAAWMAKQLGHSLKEFFDTYADWIERADTGIQMELMERHLNENGQMVGKKEAAKP